ncbi:MAG: hypothetical protein ACREBC_38240, partial [Pyrinomonadaceae bacterium]
GEPRWVRILAITGGCSMAAMNFKVHRTGSSVPYRSRTLVYDLTFALRAGIRRSKPLRRFCEQPGTGFPAGAG